MSHAAGRAYSAGVGLAAVMVDALPERLELVMALQSENARAPISDTRKLRWPS